MALAEYCLYALVGGALLGAILATTRLHMTARATWSFSMLYYVLFTSLVNARRYVIEPLGWGDRFHTNLVRALVFATAAAVVVYLIRRWRHRRVLEYMEDLEGKV